MLGAESRICRVDTVFRWGRVSCTVRFDDIVRYLGEQDNRTRACPGNTVFLRCLSAGCRRLNVASASLWCCLWSLVRRAGTLCMPFTPRTYTYTGYVVRTFSGCPTVTYSEYLSVLRVPVPVGSYAYGDKMEYTVVQRVRVYQVPGSMHTVDF
jgi:hypothetical protein